MSTPAARLLIDPDRVLNWSAPDRLAQPSEGIVELERERAAARRMAAAVGLLAALTVVLVAARQEIPSRSRLLGALVAGLRER